MLKHVTTKKKCYIILFRGTYSLDRIIGAFQKKEDAECFIDTMNSEMTSEERWQGQYLIHETEMITDWRLVSK